MRFYSAGNIRPSGWQSVWTLPTALLVLTIGCGSAPQDSASQDSAEAESTASDEPAAEAMAPDAESEPEAQAALPTEAPPSGMPDEPAHPPAPEPLPEPKGAKRLSPDHAVWIDVEKGVVIVDGNVSLRRGMLEMFACTRNTKEHESVISANTLAFTVHAALLRLGAKPGSPVEYEPEYKPPSGTEIEIEVQWRDEQGVMHKAKAQEWVRDMRTGKQMSLPWVFPGSWVAVNEVTGEKAYMAEQGDFICVSNFTTATLDVPAESSQSAEGLLFEAFTERIPPLGAPVRMTLRPKVEATAEPTDETPAGAE